QYWLFLYCCPSVCCVMGFGITSVLAFSLLLSICLLCNGIWYEKMLQSFCGQCNSSAEESSSPESQEISDAPSALPEEPTTEGLETATDQNPFPT
ncbi:MAG: hypothetical protein ACR5K9_09715, partial [Wolbachia sp.]